ncbi:MAG: hypothetical protein JWM98_1965 [Thermoleophilia bacterium]|nr:hypothetical protein [Thermoleophilia bacterium]
MRGAMTTPDALTALHDELDWHDEFAAPSSPWWHDARFWWLTSVAVLPIVVLLAVTAGSGGASTAPDRVDRAMQRANSGTGESALPVLSTSEPLAAVRSSTPRLQPIAGGTATAVQAAPLVEREVDPREAAALAAITIDESYTPPPFTPVASALSALSSGPVQGVSGDTDGLDAGLLGALSSLAGKLGRPLVVESGRRTFEEQTALRQLFLSGRGNLAAVPGTSRHELGLAADVYVGGVALANVPGARDLAASLGLCFPVGGEAWHVEPVTAPLMQGPVAH